MKTVNGMKTAIRYPLPNLFSWRTALFLSVVLMSLAVIATAEHRHRGMEHHDLPLHWWRIPQYLERLAVSDDQVAQLRELFLSSEREAIQLRADLHVKELELRHKMDESEPDQKEVRALVKEVSDLRHKLFSNKIERVLARKSILTPEQEKELQRIQFNMKMDRPQEGPRPPRPFDGPPPSPK